MTKSSNPSWNNLIISNPDQGNVFQSAEFANIKRRQGWLPRFETVNNLAITILEKQVFGLGKLWYIPKGPGATSVEELARVKPGIESLARKSGVFAVKIEPEIIKNETNLEQIAQLDLIPVRPIQPNFSTVLLDLSPDLNTIMKNLNQKGRHAIRRAERDGVTAESVESNDQNCQIMYDLLAETASGSFGIRSFDYYREFWQSFNKAGMGQLFFARDRKSVV